MAPKSNSVEKYTTIVKKYPTYRNYPIPGCWKYMEGRCMDDNAEGLWRVGDKLYDLTKFVDSHPGGASWITLTKVGIRFSSIEISDIKHLLFNEGNRYH